MGKQSSLAGVLCWELDAGLKQGDEFHGKNSPQSADKIKSPPVERYLGLGSGGTSYTVEEDLQNAIIV